MSHVADHRQIVRDVFTRSSNSYVARKESVDQASHEAMVRLSGVRSTDAVLEVACGPAFVGLLFAEKARIVVGIDLAQLEKAATLKTSRGVRNLSLVEGDVDSLPFSSESFNVVACHKAFHHLSRPGRVLQEIHRVLSTRGRLVLGDSLSSDDPAKSELHNEIERLRDPSHVKMYVLAELRNFLSSAGFEIEQYERLEDEREFDWWMSVISPPANIVEQIRTKLIESMPGDATGLWLRLDGGKLLMKRRSIVLVASKA